MCTALLSVAKGRGRRRHHKSPEKLVTSEASTFSAQSVLSKHGFKSGKGVGGGHLVRARLVFVCFVLSGGGDAGGYRQNDRRVTRHDVCKLQHFSYPCVVGLVAVGSVLGDDGVCVCEGFAYQGLHAGERG